MGALVVYESMFGNTRRIALAIAEGIAGKLPVRTLEVGDAPEVVAGDVDLLVVGGPTHVHGMSSASTRRSAAERATDPLVSQRLGIREWLDHATPQGPNVHAAAFDTRISGMALITGSAARGYTKRLRADGFLVDTPAQSFLVTAKAEPGDDALVPGQVEQARAWGAALAARVKVGA